MIPAGESKYVSPQLEGPPPVDRTGGFQGAHARLEGRDGTVQGLEASNGLEPVAYRRCAMKWAGMYFLGFALLIGGVLAALWKLGILQNIETSWIVIGVVILAGVGIMASIASSGTKQNIEIDRE